jgi:adenosylhomocysteinase
VADRSLADAGSRRVEWAGREMPVLASIRKRVAAEKPFKGLRIGACLHVTTETANLAITLRDAGASVALCASNPLSTQDDAAAALVQNEGIATFARKGEDRDTYYRHIEAVLDTKPQITMDDGADVVTLLHTTRKELLPNVKGGTEETTTGVIRLRATNILIAGKTAVVCGYGWVGRGVASRFRGMGAIVIVVEVDPLRGLEAAMDGYQVMPIADASTRGDIFLTTTGNLNVIGGQHFARMKDGAIVANAGHFNDEIEIPALEKQSKGKRTIRPFVEEYSHESGKKIFLLAEGRLLNHAAAEANPAAVMDMSFANQVLAIEYLLKQGSALKPDVYPVPADLDALIARLKLEAMGMKIDTMTDAQRTYSQSWKAGT